MILELEGEEYTYLQSRQALGIEDFQLKSSCQIALSKSNPNGLVV
jgi:hypothetical protein